MREYLRLHFDCVTLLNFVSFLPPTQVDRRTVFRLVSSMEKEGLLKTVVVNIPRSNVGGRRKDILLLHTSLSHNDPRVKVAPPICFCGGLISNLGGSCKV